MRIDVGPEVQAERFAAGMQCLGVFGSSGALVGVSWIGTGRQEDPLFGIRYELPAATAWDTGLWVPEDKRMTRAFAALWAAIGEWLRSERLAWTMSSIADYNVASITAHRRLGANELGTITILRLGQAAAELRRAPVPALAARCSSTGRPFAGAGRRMRAGRLAVGLWLGPGERASRLPVRRGRT